MSVTGGDDEISQKKQWQYSDEKKDFIEFTCNSLSTRQDDIIPLDVFVRAGLILTTKFIKEMPQHLPFLLPLHHPIHQASASHSLLLIAYITPPLPPHFSAQLERCQFKPASPVHETLVDEWELLCWKWLKAAIARKHALEAFVQWDPLFVDKLATCKFECKLCER
jgi:hypothetical protein